MRSVKEISVLQWTVWPEVFFFLTMETMLNDEKNAITILNELVYQI